MPNLDDMKGFLDENIESAYASFHYEMNSNENADYRRGYKAGVLFSYLNMKAELCDIPHNEAVVE